MGEEVGIVTFLGLFRPPGGGSDKCKYRRKEVNVHIFDVVVAWMVVVVVMVCEQ